MKINLLRMIIIATAFSSLQIHTMDPNQIIALEQVQQYFLSQNKQQQQHDLKQVPPIASTPTRQPLATNNNQNKPEAVCINMTTLNSTMTPSNTVGGLKQYHSELVEKEFGPEKNSIIDIGFQGDNVIVGCCDQERTCTKNEAAKTCFAVCSITTLIVFIVALATLH